MTIDLSLDHSKVPAYVRLTHEHLLEISRTVSEGHWITARKINHHTSSKRDEASSKKKHINYQ